MQVANALPIDDAMGLDLFAVDDGSREVPAIDRSLISADQTLLLFRQLPGNLALTLLAATIVSVTLWSNAPAAAMFTWWAALALICAGHIGLYRAYTRRRDADTVKWLRWFGIGALSAGAAWGFAGSVFFPAIGDDQRVFLAFALASVLSGAVPRLSAVWQVYALYAAGFLAPIAYVLLALGKPMSVVLAALTPVLLLANTAVSVQLSRTLAQTFKMRRAYRDIAAGHAGLKEQFHEQLDQLALAHEEISASGHKLALYIDRAPIAVFELDAQGTVLSANPMAEVMFGYPSTDIEGRSLLRTLFAADQPLLDHAQWRSFLERGQPLAERKAPCVRRDGVEILCEFSLTPLVGGEGDPMSIIVHCHDITHQVEAERLKQEFTSTLSHELRTPLTSIVGSLQLINSGVMGDLDPNVFELTQIAERNGHRLLEMINDILDIEKIASGRFTLDLETIMLGDLVKEAVLLNRPYAERFNVSLEYTGLEEQVAIVADRKRLLQVVTNLVSNAAKFSPEGAQVEISMRRADASVRVSVNDRGSGIPAEFRSRIFSRFAQADSASTRKKGGTGLGLAISKRLTEMMGGQVGFADREGGGTSFFIDLPIADAASRQAN